MKLIKIEISELEVITDPRLLGERAASHPVPHIPDGRDSNGMGQM